jgi:hypothetical protein
MSAWEESYSNLFDQDHESVVTCKYCGEDGLTWEQGSRGWKLVDEGGNDHICNMHKVAFAPEKKK